MDALARSLNDLPPALARALVLRDIRSFDAAQRFFRPALAHLHAPDGLRDMDAAAERIARAVRSGERVLVFGDYDVDGTTATALTVGMLRRLGVETGYFIPNRFLDGYGIGEKGLDAAKAMGATVVVALDCGITAHEPARYAKTLGLDLVVCDHHKPEATLPDAYAVVDPKRADCLYPFKELSGCALGFKLAQAVLERLGHDPAEAYDDLDLVAISTAADLVSLSDENRVLMAKGLERLRTSPRPGFAALAKVVGLDLGALSTEGIVFALGPRINAAGRLGDAGKAVELMLAETDAEAMERALALEACNQQRRALDQEIQGEALALAEAQMARGGADGGERQALALYGRDWHLGVIGIVASRMVERFHRPTVMMCGTGDGFVKGSARSCRGVSIHDALGRCHDLLEDFGGHDFAAGLTLREENVAAFQDCFDAAVGEAARKAETTWAAPLDFDAQIALDDLASGRFWAVLRQFAPHGPDNLAPVFATMGVDVVGNPRVVGRESQHLKLHVRAAGGPGRVFEAIGYRMGDRLAEVQALVRLGHRLDLAFQVEENVYRGERSLQLKLKDVRAAA